MTGTLGDHAPIPRRLRASTVAACVAVVFAAGCSGQRSGVGGLIGEITGQRSQSVQLLEHTVEYSLVPPTRAMVSAPQALLIFERDLGGAIEQRIVLPNETAVAGDNVIHIRAQTSSSIGLDRFNFNEIETRFGGLPAPFERMTEGSLSSGSDTLGAFVFARQSIGTGTNCVLVIRRMNLSARPLPRGTQALDVMMRNCVNGSVEQALAPMSARALAVSGTTGATNTLSPYAAPGG